MQMTIYNLKNILETNELFFLNQQNTVDKLVQRANASILIGTSSWKEQFVEALTVNPGMLFFN